MTNEIDFVLNDMGGSFMDVQKECVSPTLRREMKHHEPIIVCHGSQDPIWNEHVASCLGINNGLENVIVQKRTVMAFKYSQGSKARGIAYDSVSPTLKAENTDVAILEK